MVKKSKKLKQGNMVSEDMIQIRTLIVLLVIVALICFGIYFLTENIIKKENNSNNVTDEVNINYDIASIGTMFNRIESEYYVLLYSNEEDGSKLNSILDTYRSSDNYIKTYYIDLDLKVNSSVLGDSYNERPNNSNEVKVTGATLYKFNNGKVVNAYNGVESIKEILK